MKIKCGKQSFEVSSQTAKMYRLVAGEEVSPQILSYILKSEYQKT